jgi:phosphodiesterase/alkaline phosphatase D-like protein
MRRQHGFYGRGSRYTPTYPAAAVQWALYGAITTSSVTVKCRSVSSSVTLIYATDEDLTNTLAVSGTELLDDVWEFDVSGLTADTEYWYSFVGWDQVGRWRTFPSAAKSFSLCAASCAGSPPGGADAEYQGAGDTSNTPAWARIHDRLPLLMLQMGDWGYPDITSGVASDYWQNFKDNLSNARQAALLRDVPIDYMYSDHDYSDSDSDGTYAGKAAVAAAVRNYLPHYNYPDASAIYHEFPIGPHVRVFRLDVHYYRSPNGATDNASKTMLGATQKQWLKDGLLSATEEILVIDVNTPWNEPSAWGLYSTERQELAEYFEDNNLTDRIALLQADWHFSAFDDGTNSQYDPASVNPGPPIFHFAPLDQNATAASGTYSEGTAFDNQMYGLIDVIDLGATVAWQGTAYACPNTTSESAVLGPFSHIFAV